MIDFNVPPFIGKELEYVSEAIKNNRKISGDGEFTKKCSKLLEKMFKSNKILFTTSCTHALEMAAILIDTKPGDEIIMPSYTFVSTANAFVMRGAKIIFVDIKEDTMNINEDLIEDAITEKTKAIVPVHYAGVACNMDKIMEIANKYNLFVIEDAAQGVMSKYKGKALGTIGHFGCYSFHETKNYSMGEGGALSINDPKFIERAEIIREKGTDRSRFFRGQVDKYTWVEFGSSYLPSEINVAYLYAQLENPNYINDNRIKLWNKYYMELKKLEELNYIQLPKISKNCTHNAHMFYIKLKDLSERSKLIKYLLDNEIHSVFHYIPLHSSPAGKKFGVFNGKDIYTTKESERLLRLPLYFGMTDDDINKVINSVKKFFLGEE